eukprot:g2447.t1
MGGQNCEPKDKVEVAPCGEAPCGGECQNGEWGEWREWSPCSATCNDAYRFRRRNIARHANYCGNATVGFREEIERCEELPPCTPDSDCQTAEWTPWSSCSCHCFGMRTRSRYISQFPSGNGDPCFNETLKEIEPCNPGPDELRPADCSNIKQVDCLLNEWEEWSQCTVTCGGGQRNRVRTVAQAAMGAQVSDCPMSPACSERLFCAWNEWSFPNCDGSCGTRPAMITRTLGLHRNLPVDALLTARSLNGALGAVAAIRARPMGRGIAAARSLDIRVMVENHVWAFWKTQWDAPRCLDDVTTYSVHRNHGRPT